MAADGKETQLATVALSVQDEPLRDVLRGLAALNGRQWKRVTTTSRQPALLLGDPDDPRRWDFLRPTTQADADEHRAVEAFQSQLAGLPPQVQQALGVPHVGVPFSALPAGMQQSVRDALTASLTTFSALNATLNMPFNPKITPDALDSQQVIFRVEPGDGLTEYKLDIEAPGFGSVGMAASVPDDPRARSVGDDVTPPGRPQYQALQSGALLTAYDESRGQAVKDDPRMVQTLSIKMDDAPLGFVLSALSSETHINVIAQVFIDRHSVSLAAVPLKDALDQIAAKYHMAWGAAPDGTILMHYRENIRPPAQQATAK